MKKNKLLLILSLFLNTLIYSEELIYRDNKATIFEQVIHKKNGFIYEFKDRKNYFQMIVLTNVNCGTTEFSMISNNITNTYFLLNGKLITPKKELLDLKGLELILYPEVQLKHFIKNKEQQETCYMTLRSKNMKIHEMLAKKIEVTPELTIVELTITGVSPKFVRFLYYFNKEGIGIRKEGYFGKSKKPQYSVSI